MIERASHFDDLASICKQLEARLETEEGKYVWDKDDSSVPRGWKTTLIEVEEEGKMVESKRFMAPDGRFCASRVDALRYFKKTGGES